MPSTPDHRHGGAGATSAARDWVREDAIEAIRAAGGLPVLAHFRRRRRGPMSSRELMTPVSAASRSTTARSITATVEAVADVARRLGLVATGGTDYHGDLRTYAEAHAAL